MELSPNEVSAVLLTRGDVGMNAVLNSLPFSDIVCAFGKDDCIYDRYESTRHAKHDLIYVQDDDCIVNVAELLKQYEPGRVLCNMPMAKRAEYSDGVALVGWGAIFHRDSLKAFDGYFAKHPTDKLFEREADRVFTGLNPLKLADVPIEHLPHAHGADRMGRQPNHWASLVAIRQRIYACRA